MSAEVDPAKKIDDLIAGLYDWHSETLAQVRRLIHSALPDVEEQWKWMGSPVWELDGIIAVGNAHSRKVKLTFPRGLISTTNGVFNAGLDGNAWRAIDPALISHASIIPLSAAPVRDPPARRPWSATPRTRVSPQAVRPSGTGHSYRDRRREVR